MRTISALLIALSLAAAAPDARAQTAAPPEPATGFLLQGQLQTNLFVLPVWPYGSFNAMPVLRLGLQRRSLSASVEINYQTFAVDESNGRGQHLITVGPNLQPVIWASADRAARLVASVGAHIGGVIETRPSGSSSTQQLIIGGFNLGLGGHYFMHRNFALGLEGGLHAEFINSSSSNSTSSTTIAAVSLYVALSLSFVAGS